MTQAITPKAEVLETARHIQGVIQAEVFIALDGQSALLYHDMGNEGGYLISIDSDGDTMSSTVGNDQGWETGWEA